MKNKQLLRSAVTVVATGLTLLATNNTQAGGRGPSGGMRMGGARGGMTNGATHQSIGGRAISRLTGSNHVIGHNKTEQRATTRMNRGDDRGGHGERERRHGNDDGVRHDLRDDKGARGERERERRH